jgi:excisionase family DNA binding protein
MATMNENNEITLTTSQAALLLEVHESSVKRWSNSGDLKLEKTTGGHRRIPFDALINFARARELSSGILFFAPHEEEVARAAFDAREHDDFTGVRELVLRFCDTESPRWLVNLFGYLEGVFGIPIAKIFDDGIAGALGEVGRQWQSGSRTIALEHRFTQKILDALHGLLNAMDHEPVGLTDADLAVKRPHAIIGCAEACHHEIGAFMARVLLLRAGWSVTYLGANVPFEEIAGIQELERAQMVCLSFSLPLGASDVRRCLKVLNALRQPLSPYQLTMGGLPFLAGTETQYETMIPLTFATSMQGFEKWVGSTFVHDTVVQPEAFAETAV